MFARSGTFQFIIFWALYALYIHSPRHETLAFQLSALANVRIVWKVSNAIFGLIANACRKNRMPLELVS